MCSLILLHLLVALCPLLNPFKVFQIPTVLILTSPVTKTNNNCKKIKDCAICCAGPKLSYSYWQRFWKKVGINVQYYFLIVTKCQVLINFWCLLVSFLMFCCWYVWFNNVRTVMNEIQVLKKINFWCGCLLMVCNIQRACVLHFQNFIKSSTPSIFIINFV